MAALTANRRRYRRGVARKGYAVGADSMQFYEGQLVVFDTAGKLRPAADTSGFRIAGVATKKESTGASNTREIEFEFGHEEWFPITGITAADKQAMGMVADDNTVTDAATATNDVEVGLVQNLETKGGVSGAWFRIAEFGPDSA